MKLIDTYKEWSSYFYQDAELLFIYKLNTVMKMMKPLHEMKMDDITEEHIATIKQWNHGNINLELMTLLLICLRRWDKANIAVIHKNTSCKRFHDPELLHYKKHEDLRPTLHEDSTVDEVYAIWREEHFPLFTENQKTLYDYVWKRLKPVWNREFRLLRMNDIQNILNECSEDTAYRLIGTLQKLSEEMYINDYLDTIHFKTLRPIEHPAKIHQIITIDEIQTLLQLSHTYITAQLMAVQVYTGLKLKTLLSMQQDWIDANQEVLYLPDRRIIPIHPSISWILHAWKEELPLLIRTDRIKMPMKRLYCKGMVKIVSVAYLNREICPKDLKYTFIHRVSLCEEATATQKNILCGYKPNTVGCSVYTHPTVDTLRNIINSLE